MTDQEYEQIQNRLSDLLSSRTRQSLAKREKDAWDKAVLAAKSTVSSYFHFNMKEKSCQD